MKARELMNNLLSLLKGMVKCWERNMGENLWGNMWQFHGPNALPFTQLTVKDHRTYTKEDEAYYLCSQQNVIIGKTAECLNQIVHGRC